MLKNQLLTAQKQEVRANAMKTKYQREIEVQLRIPRYLRNPKTLRNLRRKHRAISLICAIYTLYTKRLTRKIKEQDRRVYFG